MTDDPEIPVPLDRVAGYLLRRAHGLFVTHWQLAFTRQAIPITPVQGGVLTIIHERQGLAQTALARALNVDDATLVQSLDRLVALGFIRRVRRSDDRRSYALHITDDGEAALEQVAAFLVERDDTLLGALNDGERDQLLTLLSKVVIGGGREVKALQRRIAAAAGDDEKEMPA